MLTVELIEERKCASNEEVVRERITKLQEIWEKLTKQSQAKSRYLMESNQLQQYNNNVKELDYWLSEVGLSRNLDTLGTPEIPTKPLCLSPIPFHYSTVRFVCEQI